jgi:hypothetical protein
MITEIKINVPVSICSEGLIFNVECFHSRISIKNSAFNIKNYNKDSRSKFRVLNRNKKNLHNMS